MGALGVIAVDAVLAAAKLEVPGVWTWGLAGVGLVATLAAVGLEWRAGVHRGRELVVRGGFAVLGFAIGLLVVAVLYRIAGLA